MSYHQHGEHKAVFIFEADKLVRQLLWLEFEAVLDGFVPLIEQASQQVHAVYLTLAPGPVVKAAVFFLIDFDAEGYADKRWNIPLQQFADSSAAGPDLGDGPIKLACRSQCPVSWHSNQLWDPEMDVQGNHFSTIKKAVLANRLNLPAAAPVAQKVPLAGASSSGEPADFAQLLESERKRAAAQLQEQQLRLATLQEKHRGELESLNQQHASELRESGRQLLSEKQALAREQKKVRQLEDHVSGLQQKIGGLREYFEHKLDNLKSVEQAALKTLVKQQQVESEEAVAQASAALKEQLQIRDIEVMYRDTQLQNLQHEIEKLQQDRQELLQNSGDHLLERLHKGGISFVTFQPGAGQITLPLKSLVEFLEDKYALVANKCGVSRQDYLTWLAHFRQPQCEARDENGRRCQQAVTRVNQPSAFVAGYNDHCQAHRQIGDADREADCC